MRSKLIAALAAIVVTIGVVGGVSFAAGATPETQKDNKVQIAGIDVKTQNVDAKAENSTYSSAKSSNNSYNGMISAMRDNGLNVAADYM